MVSVETVLPGSIGSEELAALYASVGWQVYSHDPERLLAAIEQSTYVVVIREDDALVGLVRVMSDDVSILYVQDLLVRPDRQGEGIGRLLLRHVLDRFSHVRRKVLLTDDEERQHRLYASEGFSDVRGIERLHAFARFEDQ